MKTTRYGICALLAVLVLGLSGPGDAQIMPPEGDLLARNRDLAAGKAFEQWIAQLETSPHLAEVRNIGILPLGGDEDGFTAILAARLSALGRFQVVILGGEAWNAIEDELARQDPNEGLGDIMNKATIKWRETRAGYDLPETAVGADALLIGRVRGVDRDWWRARTRFILEFARVDTRTMIGGGLVEGESRLGWEDMLIYYKTQLLWGAAGIVVLVILLALFSRFIRATRRVR